MKKTCVFITLLHLFITLLDLFITLLDLFITLLDLFVNDTEKNEWLIVYTLLYYIYYLNVKVFCNFLPVVS